MFPLTGFANEFDRAPVAFGTTGTLVNLIVTFDAKTS